jgi:pyruvate dehydrogenase (quinone)/pyruvate oxidase
VKALLGKGVVPDDHPLTTGGIGLLGTEPSSWAMENADTLLIVGSSFPYQEFLPKPGAVRAVQEDDKADRIGLRYPVEVGLVGDAKATAKALRRLVRRKAERGFLEKAQERMAEWREHLEKSAVLDDVPIKPQRVDAVLSRVAEDDAVVSTDSGTITTWVARHFELRKEQLFSCSGTLATMAPALPYAIAAKLAFPARQSFAFIGDGGFTMLMGEFLTAVKYELPIVCVVVKNGSLGQIKWEQIVFLGNPEYGCELNEMDFAKFAEACGGVGFDVEKPDEIGPALEKALASKRPCVVAVAVDPNEPPMPPRASAKQAARVAEALAKGEPGAAKVMEAFVRDKVRELV